MDEIERIWRTFRIDMKLASTYPQAKAVRSDMTFAVPLPWLDDLMATLLFIRAMEIHDDALQSVIGARGEVPPRKYYKTLRGRLEYCSDHWPAFTGDVLKAHADRRNAVAHDAGQKATWRELNACVSDVERSLIALGCIGGPIVVDVEYERTRAPSKSVGTHQMIWNVRINVNGASYQVWQMTEQYSIAPANPRAP